MIIRLVNNFVRKYSCEIVFSASRTYVEKRAYTPMGLELYRMIEPLK